MKCSPCNPFELHPLISMGAECSLCSIFPKCFVNYLSTFHNIQESSGAWNTNLHASPLPYLCSLYLRANAQPHLWTLMLINTRHTSKQHKSHIRNRNWRGWVSSQNRGRTHDLGCLQVLETNGQVIFELVSHIST